MLDFVKEFHEAFRGATWAFFVVVSGGFAVVGLLLGWMVHGSIEKSKAESQESDARSRQLTVEWHYAPSAVLPPEGRISVLELFELPLSNGGGGLAEVMASPALMLSARRPTGFRARYSNIALQITALRRCSTWRLRFVCCSRRRSGERISRIHWIPAR